MYFIVLKIFAKIKKIYFLRGILIPKFKKKKKYFDIFVTESIYMLNLYCFIIYLKPIKINEKQFRQFFC